MDVKEFLAPLVEAGVTIVEADETEIDGYIQKLSTETITGAVTALNGTLTAGGIAGLAEGAFKKADVAAEGTLEADADAALDGLVAKVISLAQAYAAPAAAPPAPEVPPTTETPAQ